MMKNYLIVLLIFSSLTMWADSSYAGIGAIPTYKEESSVANTKITGSFNVYNTGDNAVDVDVYFKDYYKSEENKSIRSKHWLHVRPMKFNLGPKANREVKYIARVPEDAVGEIMTLIFFRAPSAPESNVMMSFGVSLYVAIEGTEILNGEIENINIEKIFAPAGGNPPQYNIKVILKNSGNVHLRPQINIKMYKDKKVLKTVDFPYGWPVFPGSDYEYIASWQEREFKFKQGSYKAVAEVKIGDQELKRATAFYSDKDGNIKMKRIKDK